MNYASHCGTSALSHNTHGMKKRFQISFLETVCGLFHHCATCLTCRMFLCFVCARSSVCTWTEFLFVLLIDCEKHVQHLESKTCFLRVSYRMAEYHKLE